MKREDSMFRFTSILIIFFVLIGQTAFGQNKPDTLIINAGQSKLIFIINSPEDLKEFEKYDLNAVLKNLKLKLTSDSVLVSENTNEAIKKDTTVVVADNEWREQDNDDDRWRNKEDDSWRGDYSSTSKVKKRGAGSTRHLINFDLGTNNYLSDGKFPEESDAQYAVRPWGSWYVGINSIYQTNVKGRFYIEWGPGISWYNFKFQDDRTRITEVDGVTTFIQDPDLTRDYKKSKLTASFINFTAVPMFQFGQKRERRSSNFSSLSNWNKINIGRSYGGFRMGVGGYAGFRLGSHSKVKLEGGDKDKERDNFNLNNFRYGVRVQMGFRGTDLFFNYDMNELFTEDKGPKLNAFSFGIIL
ncbi:hypothetical protein [Fulvivirga lutea]|uniref:Outer membrane protein beta-barrel domain-containing protein n=1 Tax=Fulvivirga lutea TaxID=2810512 RepID=A0A974WEP4_9BACT|nr:hypothetical protein [Fulvivirga lutea]QSE96023.1 hypothetical protein JR347_10385 [Fulvivirga lutea]